MFFHGYDGCTNAPQCYFIRTVSVLFKCLPKLVEEHGLRCVVLLE
jgi:hypothetical protein